MEAGSAPVRSHGDRDTSAAESAGPGRPRDPTTEERVYAAAKEELADGGFEAFSMRGVARRSGVSRPSLLLRWPTKDLLILDTLEKLVEWPSPRPGADVRSEIAAIVAHVSTLMDGDMLPIQLRLIADAPGHPELFEAFQDKVIYRAGNRLVQLLERAVAEGELSPETDVRWAADALIGVIFMRTIRSRGQRPPSGSAQRQIVDSLWRALGGR